MGCFKPRASGPKRSTRRGASMDAIMLFRTEIRCLPVLGFCFLEMTIVMSKIVGSSRGIAV